MTIEAIKDQLLSIWGCCVAIFVSVWIVHGADHTLKFSVLLAIGLVGVLAGLSNLVWPGLKRGVPTDADMRNAFTPVKTVIYTLGFLAFGAFIVVVGWL